MGLFQWLRQIFAPKPKPTPTPTPGPTPVPDDAINQMIDAINQVRIRYGARGLVAGDARLNKIAQDWANYMAQRNYFNHGAFGQRLQSVYPNTAGAENIAMGPVDPNQIVQMWVNSPGHYRNMMGPYNFVGIGYAKGLAGYYWCLDLAKV